MTATNRETEAMAANAQRASEAGHFLENCTGPEAIAHALAQTMDTRADLARLSGLTAETLRAIERGKRPTRAQRAALSWAIFRRWTR